MSISSVPHKFHTVLGLSPILCDRKLVTKGPTYVMAVAISEALSEDACVSDVSADITLGCSKPHAASGLLLRRYHSFFSPSLFTRRSAT